MTDSERPAELEIATRLQTLELENAALRAQLAALATAGPVASVDPARRDVVRRRRWLGRLAQAILIGVGIVIGAAVFGDERRDFEQGFRDGLKAGTEARQTLDAVAPRR